MKCYSENCSKEALFSVDFPSTFMKLRVTSHALLCGLHTSVFQRMADQMGEFIVQRRIPSIEQLDLPLKSDNT